MHSTSHATFMITFKTLLYFWNLFQFILEKCAYFDTLSYNNRALEKFKKEHLNQKRFKNQTISCFGAFIQVSYLNDIIKLAWSQWKIIFKSTFVEFLPTLLKKEYEPPSVPFLTFFQFLLFQYISVVHIKLSFLCQICSRWRNIRS